MLEKSVWRQLLRSAESLLCPQNPETTKQCYELQSLGEILKTLKWLSTLGLSELKDVKMDVIDLISELSKSLTSLWEVVTQATNIKKKKFGKESFGTAYDYFLGFYAGDWNISPARTHCGNVERAVGRIKFKVGKILHTDLGKWNEVDEKLKEIVDGDGVILYEYDQSIKNLDSEMNQIKTLLDKDKDSEAKTRYYDLKAKLESDIRFLRKGIKRMEMAIDHVNKVAG